MVNRGYSMTRRHQIPRTLRFIKPKVALHCLHLESSLNTTLVLGRLAMVGRCWQ